MNLFRKHYEKKRFENVCKRSGCVAKVKFKDNNVEVTPRVLGLSEGEFFTITFTIPKGLMKNEFEKSIEHFKQEYGIFSYFELEHNRGVLRVYPVDPFEKVYPFQFEKAPLGMAFPIFVGYEDGTKHFIDLSVLPHILICGTTGSGKSVQIRNILTNLVLEGMKIELFLFDLKRTEFFLFRRLKNVTAYETEVEAIKRGLTYIKRQLDERGNQLEEQEQAMYTDIGLHPLFVCIDEMQDLAENEDCMSIIKEVAAKGRALGIFLLISTQRPDSSLLSGILKNNLNVTMAFKMKNATSSRVAIDEAGAEEIKNVGECILSTTSYSTRIKAPYLPVDEAKKLLQPYLLPPQQKDGGGNEGA